MIKCKQKCIEVFMEEKLKNYLSKHYGYISSKEFEQIGISKSLISK